jgi:hypothetical protein
MKHLFLILTAIATLTGCSPDNPAREIADRVFELARIQYSYMDEALAEDTFPRCTDEEGKLVTTKNVGWWCSGFHPGSLWYIYEYTGDGTFREMAWKYTDRLETLLDRKCDHDIGFQINCSYGNALRLTGDSLRTVPVYIAAAHKLAERFDPEAGVIRSWDFLRNDWIYPVIIDNMMNLELLTKASRLSGRDVLMETAVKHASTTLANHFREDWTSWHLLDYDPEDGKVRYRETVQGYAHGSAWARGQAWALYGYTMMARETGRKEFLEAAENIGRMLISKLPEDGIPYWDFNAPGTEEAMDSTAAGATLNGAAYLEKPLRDASAGAIMASAFAELSTLTDDRNDSAEYLETALRQITTLASEEYLAQPGENGFFLLKHSVGNIPADGEIDVALSYADYYFLEALVRCSSLN